MHGGHGQPDCTDLTASLLHFVNDASANLMLLLENGGRTKKKVNHRRYLQKQLEQCRPAAAAAAAAAGHLSPTGGCSAATTPDSPDAPLALHSPSPLPTQCDDVGVVVVVEGVDEGRMPSKARKSSYSRRKARRSNPTATMSSSSSSSSSTPPQSRRSSLVEACGAGGAADARAALRSLQLDGCYWEQQLSNYCETELERGGGGVALSDESLDSAAAATAATTPHWADVFEDPIADFLSSHCSGGAGGGELAFASHGSPVVAAAAAADVAMMARPSLADRFPSCAAAAAEPPRLPAAAAAAVTPAVYSSSQPAFAAATQQQLAYSAATPRAYSAATPLLNDSSLAFPWTRDGAPLFDEKCDSVGDDDELQALSELLERLAEPLLQPPTDDFGVSSAAHWSSCSYNCSAASAHGPPCSVDQYQQSLQQQQQQLLHHHQQLLLLQHHQQQQQRQQLQQFV